MLQFFALVVISLWVPLAAAQDGANGISGGIGGYLFHERLEIDTPGNDPSDSSMGFGVKGHLLFTENFFAAVEFQDAELSSFRLLGGALLPANETTDWILAAGLVDKDIDDGVGLFGGVRHQAEPQLELKALLGILLLEEFDGPELTLGAAYNIDRYVSIFADLRLFQGNGNDRVDFSTSEFHIGATYNFNI